MSFDFNSFDAGTFNAFLDSGFNARGAHPFTIRYWAKCPEPVNFPDGGTNHVSRDTDVFGSIWRVSRISNASDPISNDYAQFTMGPPIGGPPATKVQAAGWLYDEWNHIVAGFDGDSIFIQLNNSARVTTPFGRTVHPTPGGSLRIRGYPATQIGFVPSVEETTIDGLAIWDGRALSASDVADDWNEGAGRDYASTSQEDLLAYWDFDAFSAPDQFTDEQAGYVLTWIQSGTGPGERTIVAGKIGSAVHVDWRPTDQLEFSNTGYYGIFSDDFDFS